jgi:hypothetical protein
MGGDCMYGCSVNSVALCSVNHCSREEPASHSPTVPWVCDARDTGACLGRPYLRACGVRSKGQGLFKFRPVSVGLKSNLALNSRESGSVRAWGEMAT